jgi:hypothetical protein
VIDATNPLISDPKYEMNALGSINPQTIVTT